jgi:hypothetical protein
MQEILEFLLYHYKLQTEARRLFMMIARHDYEGVRRAVFTGEKYHCNQKALFVKEKEALEVSEAWRSSGRTFRVSDALTSALHSKPWVSGRGSWRTAWETRARCCPTSRGLSTSCCPRRDRYATDNFAGCVL